MSVSSPSGALSDLPFARPILGAEEQELVARVLDGHILTHGPQNQAFETAFAQRLGVRHAVAVSSCTAGMHLALAARGVGPGDEVIVPAMTHVATAHVVEHCGAVIRFVDVLAETGCIDPHAVARAMTERTKAVLPVHYLGLTCDMDALSAVADPAGVAIIEDAATGLGSLYGDRPAGTLGLAGAFSFYPTKHMTTLEGGMLVTNDDVLADLVRKKRAFGYDKGLGERALPGVYDIAMLGWNYRMNEVQAAIGLCQLQRLDGFLERRRLNAQVLTDRLSGIPGIKLFPAQHGKSRSSHFCVNVTLPEDGSIPREGLMRHLGECGIGFSVHYPVALPFSRYYAGKFRPAQTDFPVARWLAAQTLSLPCGPHLTPADMDRVAEAVISYLQDEA